MVTPTHSNEKHPLSGGMDHALDGEFQGNVKQLRRPGDPAAQMQSAANASPQVAQLRASEAAANTAVIQRKQTNTTGLPGDLKSGIESLSGFSLDHVRVVYNSSEPAKVNALAYAEGSVIHVAPGQEAHLPEEAWHVVQQMQGRVKPTTEVAGQRINDEEELEKEAEEMGAKAAGTTAGSPVGASVAPSAPGPESRVKQLKSRFTELKNDTNVKTPVHALSDQIKEYFEAVGMSEVYKMHGGKSIVPSTYNGSYARAHRATAVIEKASLGKNGDRDNDVIGPYGHFGWMERSIMGKDDEGNLFDGGHLIERSLMEDADADCHGNLAPQEGKGFNQNLMRGWEHIAEKYQHSMDFTYRVKLEYPDDTYTRTGAELVEAGVIHQGLVDKLGGLKEKRDEEFKTKNFVFPRWVPHVWKAKIDVGEGKVFPEKNFSKGKHYNNLVGSEEDARRDVFEKDPGNLKTSEGLVSHSGAVSGWIPNLKASEDQKRFFVGGTRKIKAHMFCGFPQPNRLQKKRDRKIRAHARKLKVFNGKVNLLKRPFSLGRITKDLKTVRVRTIGKKKSKVLKDDTILNSLKHSHELTTLRKRLGGASYLASFVKRLKKDMDEDPAFKLTTSIFQEYSKSYFDEGGKGFAQTIVFDPNFKEEVVEDEEIFDEEDKKSNTSENDAEIIDEILSLPGEDLIDVKDLEEEESIVDEEEEFDEDEMCEEANETITHSKTINDDDDIDEEL